MANELYLNDEVRKIWISDIIATKNGKAVLIDPTAIFFK